jgi:hypothetical protein
MNESVFFACAILQDCDFSFPFAALFCNPKAEPHAQARLTVWRNIHTFQHNFHISQ